jgi:hypothetical protein
MPVLSRAERAAARNRAALDVQKRRNAEASKAANAGDLDAAYVAKAKADRKARQDKARAAQEARAKVRPGSHRIVPSSSASLHRKQAKLLAKAETEAHKPPEGAVVSEQPAKRGRPKKSK